MSQLHLDDRIPERASTRYVDYVLSSYEPLCDPEGRLHSASVWRWGLRQAGLLDVLWPAAEALTDHLGPDRTVWGLKWSPLGFSTEVYFYNNASNPPEHPMQVSRLSEVLSPWLSTASQVDEQLPYFMCSLELSPESLEGARAEPWRIYLGSGDQTRRPCGFSYRVEGHACELENHYWFYSPGNSDELADLRSRLLCSPRSGGARGAHLLPADLLDCHTVCYAVKPQSDSLYFSRISTGQLLAFLRVRGPRSVTSLFEAHAADFAHLRWDLGYDFHVDAESGQNIQMTKVGIYGFA